jgi:hypothetical protein
MGCERAHAQLLSEGEGLAVMGFGLAVLWWLTSCHNVAEKT